MVWTLRSIQIYSISVGYNYHTAQLSSENGALQLLYVVLFYYTPSLLSAFTSFIYYSVAHLQDEKEKPEGYRTKLCFKTAPHRPTSEAEFITSTLQIFRGMVKDKLEVQIVANMPDGVLFQVETDDKTGTQLQVWTPREIPNEPIKMPMLLRTRMAIEGDQLEYSATDGKTLILGALSSCPEITQARIPFVVFHLMMDYLTPNDFTMWGPYVFHPPLPTIVPAKECATGLRKAFSQPIFAPLRLPLLNSTIEEFFN